MTSICDGSTYISNLSSFIRNHELQLANALLAYKKSSSRDKQKPVRLSLTLHHLYFLLDNFHQMGLATGPLNIRIQDIDDLSSYENSYSQQEYVSFLLNNYKLKRMSNYSSSMNSNDNSSITLMSSVKSALSLIWNSIASNNVSAAGPPESVIDNPVIANHLRYLYLCFNKLPCLRVSPDLNSKLIRNYQEFPFDTVIPLSAFKNLSILEISEISPKEVFGWHVLAEILKFLIVKNVDLNGKIDLLLGELVWQDYNNRKINSSNSVPSSPVVSTFSEKKTKKRHKSFANIRKNTHSMHLSAQRRAADGVSLPLQAKLLTNKWKNLRYLSLINGNISQIGDDSFKPLENLSSLDLLSNQLTGIPVGLKWLKNLKSLNLSSNSIEDLSNFLFFTGKANLTLVNLKNNNLSNLDGLEQLTGLTKIDLSNNQIHYLRHLKQLFMSGIEEQNENKAPLENFEPGLKINGFRAALHSLALANNPLQMFDKNYRIKLFNLSNMLGWKELKINGSLPSYLETYYLITDENDALLNFQKYLYSQEDYFHQYRPGEAGLLKSISHVFQRKEDDDLIRSVSQMTITPKRFPNTVETRPIPVNIKENKLYYAPGYQATATTTATLASSPRAVSDDGTVKLSGMLTSKSLNNLLNFAAVAAPKHERTKLAISYISTNTLTD